MAHKEILTDWTLKYEKVLIENYNKKGIRASGKFEDSIVHDITENSTTISGAMYIGGVITGRKPNTNQDPEALRKWVGWFGANVFTKWCENKGISTLYAYAIAWKVARKGWSIPNEYNKGDLLKDTFTIDSIQELQKEIGRFYVTNIVSDIQKSWQ